MPNRAISWNSPVVVFAVVFCLVLGTATLVTRALYANSGRKSARVAAPGASTFVANWREIASVGHSEGNLTAPVVLVLFADYQCPGCAELHKLLQVAEDSLPGVVRVVRRHFPLSSHAHAIAAANAAECAAEQGRFREFENLAYRLQDSIGIKPWAAFATEAGVRNVSDFAQCVSKQRHASAVERDRKVARELKLEGTPVYLVNGASHFGAPPIAELLAQLRAAQVATITSARDTGAALNAMSVTASAAAGLQRRWLAPLVLERTITGADRDELLMPSSLTATGDGQLVLFDFGGMEVRAFNRQGAQLWRRGRKGGGPGEFRNAMDVKVRGNGEMAVLDMGNRRITTLSATGRVLRTIPLKLSSHRFVPLADTSFYALAADDSSTLWIGVNAQGSPTRKLAAPAALVAQQAIERETFSAPLVDGAVIAFRWSDKIALLHADGSVRRVIAGIEPVPFPGTKSYPLRSGKFGGLVFRISPEATPGALSVTTRQNEIFVLFAGATSNRGRIVDVYDRQSGAYLRSHLFPFPVLELVALPDGAFASLRSDPIPSIDIWNGVGARQQ